MNVSTLFSSRLINFNDDSKSLSLISFNNIVMQYVCLGLNQVSQVAIGGLSELSSGTMVYDYRALIFLLWQGPSFPLMAKFIVCSMFGI